MNCCVYWLIKKQKLHIILSKIYSSDQTFPKSPFQIRSRKKKKKREIQKHTFRQCTPDSTFRWRRRRRIPTYCGSESAHEGWSKQLKSVGSTALFFSSSDELQFPIVSSAILRSFRRILHQKPLIQWAHGNPTVNAWGGRWRRPAGMIGCTTGFDACSGYGVWGMDIGARKFRAAEEFRSDSVYVWTCVRA